MASITPERRARLEREKRQNSGRGNFYSMKGKEHDTIRLLPLGPNDDVGVKYVYYFLGNKSFVCNFETHKEPGIITAVKRALQRLSDAEAQEKAKAIDEARRGKFLMKVISRSDAEPRVYVFEAPKAIYNAAFNALDKDGEDISHPKEGRDIRWSKQDGTSGRTTKYDTRLKDMSPLHESKEVRLKLIADAEKIDLSSYTAPDEAGAAEALREIVGGRLWKMIKADLPKVESTDGDEDAGGDDDGDEDAPKAKAKAALADTDDADDDDVPPPKAKAKPAPADDDGDDEPAPKAKAKPPVDEDDDAPAPKAKAKPAADDEDDDLPPPKAAKKPAVTEDDDEAPTAPANKKKAYEVNDDDDAPAPKKRAAIADDEDD